MIKLLHVISDTNIGGAGRYLLTYLGEYDRENYDVKVVLPVNSKLIKSVEDLGVPVITVDGIADKSFDIHSISKLKKIFKEECPDIVHTHAAISARIAARRAGVKATTYTRHSVFEPAKRLTRGFGKKLNVIVNNLTSNKIIAVAEAAKKNVTDTGVDPSKIRVVYNGVKPLEVYNPEQKSKVREKLSLPMEEPVIALIARVTEVKGQDYFIRSAKILKDKGYKVKFVIAGTGDKEEEFRHLAHKLDVEDTVVFTGFLTDVTGLMNVMDIQANASFGTEAASLSLMEGMSLGKPAVVSDYGGNPELITDGLNGFVVPQKDENAMAKAIMKLLDNKDIYSKVSASAQKIYEERFTAKIMTRNMELFYQDILKEVKQ